MNERVQTILSKASPLQTQWVTFRLTSKTDNEAAKKLRIPLSTVSRWENKAELSEAVSLLLADGAQAAATILSGHAAEAAKVVLDLMNNKKVKAEVRLRAAQTVLGKNLPDKVEHGVTVVTVTSDDMAKAKKEAEEWEQKTFSPSG